MWVNLGTIQPVHRWVSAATPLGAAPDVLRIAFTFHGNSLRIYSRIFVRQVYDAEGDSVRSQSIRVFPDLNEQVIRFPPISGAVLKFVEIKKGYRSWRWSHIKDAPHLIQIACFVPE